MNVIEVSNIIEKSIFDIKNVFDKVVTDTVAQPFMKVDDATVIETKVFKVNQHTHTFEFNKLLHLEHDFMKAVIENEVTREFDTDIITMLKECATDVNTVGECLQHMNENTVLLVNPTYTGKVDNLVMQQAKKIVLTDLVDTVLAFDGACLFVSTNEFVNQDQDYCETLKYVDKFLTVRQYIVGTLDSHHVYHLATAK